MPKVDSSKTKNKSSDFSRQDFEDAVAEFNLATLEDLDKALKDHNSKIFKVFGTRQYMEENFVTKDEFNEKMDKNFELLDKIYGHVKRMDEEQTVVSHKVETHEVRITHIESAIA